MNMHYGRRFEVELRDPMSGGLIYFGDGESLPSVVEGGTSFRTLQRNLHPYFQERLVGRTFEDLCKFENIWQDIEEVRRRAVEFRNSSNRSGRAIELDLAYQRPSP